MRWLLLLALLQATHPPPLDEQAGIELNPADPSRTNYEVMSACVRQYGACKVLFTPGTYYLRAVIDIPLGISHAYFKNVVLIPCAKMSLLVRYTDNLVGMPPTVQIHDLVVDKDSLKPCGTFVPPLHQVSGTHGY
jgi:hypothetical protein